MGRPKGSKNKIVDAAEYNPPSSDPTPLGEPKTDGEVAVVVEQKVKKQRKPRVKKEISLDSLLADYKWKADALRNKYQKKALKLQAKIMDGMFK